MFKIYDLNYNPVDFPVDKLGYGLKGLDISIGPVLYNSIYSESDGGSDVPIKRYPSDRSASIQILFTAADTIDWRLKRSQIYEFFRQLGVFYLAESHEPFKLLKVIVDEDYEFDRPVTIWGQAEVPLKVLKPIFRQSLHTTQTIDTEGLLANDKWAYGMGLSGDEREWGYSYKPSAFEGVRRLSGEDYIYGFISGTGNVSQVGTGAYTINEGFIDLVKGATYQFIDRGNHPQLNYWWLYMYDDDETFIERIPLNSVGSGREHTFTAKGTKLKIMINPIYPVNENRIDLSRFGVDVLPRLNRYANQHGINFFNSGTEEIKLIKQKESEVRIDIKSSANWFEIYDGETTFRLNKAVKSGDVLRIRGHTITLNGNNAMEDTNFNFLSVKKGWNEWEIRNLADFEFKIDFRFLYD